MRCVAAAIPNSDCTAYSDIVTSGIAIARSGTNSCVTPIPSRILAASIVGTAAFSYHETPLIESISVTTLLANTTVSRDESIPFEHGKILTSIGPRATSRVNGRRAFTKPTTMSSHIDAASIIATSRCSKAAVGIADSRRPRGWI